MDKKTDEKETELSDRMKVLKELEMKIKQKEKLFLSKEKSKKQVLLRLSPALWEALANWADEDFRSVNGQIEYLLSECVKNKEKQGG